MDPFSREAVQQAYDAVARDYQREFGRDLDQLPLDRAVLDAAIEAAPAGGWVVEAGSGPGPAAAYLGDRAPKLLALDVSLAMLQVAGEANPGRPRAQADLRHLPLRDGACSVVLAFYVLQHLPRTGLAAAFGEMYRILAPGGVLAVATHLGTGEVAIDDFLGHRVAPFGGAFDEAGAVLDAVRAAGFSVELEQQREALPHEYDSRRLYLVVRRG